MFGIIEILALIAIVSIAFKLFFMVFVPKVSANMSRKLVKNAGLAYYSAFVGAVVILYFLYAAGVSIIEILAVALFLRLIYGMALIPFARQMSAKLDVRKLVSQLWLLILFVIVLLAWGVKELFF